MEHEAPESGVTDTATHTSRESGAPTESLVAGAVGDRCVNCGSPLTSDQRYCVVCGERRGAARFTLPASGELAASPVESAAVSTGRPPRSPRFSSLTTLIAGVATLLLAMLVGVLIGHNTASHGTNTVAAAPSRVVIDNTGGSSSGSSSGSASGSSVSTKSKGAARAHHRSAKAPKVSPKVAKSQASAAAKALGGNATKALPPATVTEGQSGTGPGFNKKSHKFTGQFFGQ